MGLKWEEFDPPAPSPPTRFFFYFSGQAPDPQPTNATAMDGRNPNPRHMSQEDDEDETDYDERAIFRLAIEAIVDGLDVSTVWTRYHALASEEHEDHGGVRNIEWSQLTAFYTTPDPREAIEERNLLGRWRLLRNRPREWEQRAFQVRGELAQLSVAHVWGSLLRRKNKRLADEGLRGLLSTPVERQRRSQQIVREEWQAEQDLNQALRQEIERLQRVPIPLGHAHTRRAIGLHGELTE